MNYKTVRHIISKILRIESLLIMIPLIVCLSYKESLINYLSFLISSAILLAVSFLLDINTKNATKMKAKEGLAIVGLSWIFISIFGSLPFIFSGVCDKFYDALFETCSGFSTTGATIFNDVEILPKSILFYRSLTQWFGGMGILVFVLSLMTNKEEGNSIHLLRAESTGPTVGKLSTKMKFTTRILYFIYIGFTLLEIVLLVLGGNKVFDSICLSLSTMATGGFSLLNSGIATYSIYTQYVIAVFMLLAGINFALYYYIFIKQFKKFFFNEELRTYLIIVVLATIGIFINTYKIYNNFEETFRNSLFSVTSIISTTGFTTVDFASWPSLSLIIIIIIMITGSCAGSTSGGLKISRLLIISKSSIKRIKTKANENRVEVIKLDNSPLEDTTVRETKSFFTTYIFLIIIFSLLISIDGTHNLLSNMSASLSCLSNIGPGLDSVGPIYNYSSYSGFSKILMSLEMILGRLELYPILILFNPQTWSKY